MSVGGSVHFRLFCSLHCVSIGNPTNHQHEKNIQHKKNPLLSIHIPTCDTENSTLESKGTTWRCIVVEYVLKMSFSVDWFDWLLVMVANLASFYPILPYLLELFDTQASRPLWSSTTGHVALINICTLKWYPKLPFYHESLPCRVDTVSVHSLMEWIKMHVQDDSTLSLVMGRGCELGTGQCLWTDLSLNTNQFTSVLGDLDIPCRYPFIYLQQSKCSSMSFTLLHHVERVCRCVQLGQKKE